MFAKVLQKTLTDWIWEEIQQRANRLDNPSKLIQQIYGRLCSHPKDWTFGDFQELGAIMGISASSLMRLFEHKSYQFAGNISPKNQQKILAFLHLESWEELEQQILIRLVRQALNSMETA